MADCSARRPTLRVRVRAQKTRARELLSARRGGGFECPRCERGFGKICARPRAAVSADTFTWFWESQCAIRAYERVRVAR